MAYDKGNGSKYIIRAIGSCWNESYRQRMGDIRVYSFSIYKLLLINGKKKKVKCFGFGFSYVLYGGFRQTGNKVKAL